MHNIMTKNGEREMTNQKTMCLSIQEEFSEYTERDCLEATEKAPTNKSPPCSLQTRVQRRVVCGEVVAGTAIPGGG